MRWKGFGKTESQSSQRHGAHRDSFFSRRCYNTSDLNFVACANPALIVEQLLSTKFYIPPIRPELVARPRLIERLNAGLQRKLTLISAAAGFGKTTLISEWLADAERGDPKVRAAWGRRQFKCFIKIPGWRRGRRNEGILTIPEGRIIFSFGIGVRWL
jgi:hypothetical protein